MRPIEIIREVNQAIKSGMSTYEAMQKGFPLDPKELVLVLIEAVLEQQAEIDELNRQKREAHRESESQGPEPRPPFQGGSR